MLIRGDELWLQQACASLLKQIALTHLLRPHLVPGGPAHCKRLVHDSLESLLAERFDTLLLLALQLLLHATLELSLVAAASNHRIAGLLQLPAQLSHACLELIDLLLTLNQLLFGRHEALLLHLDLPASPPVRVR